MSIRPERVVSMMNTCLVYPPLLSTCKVSSRVINVVNNRAHVSLTAGIEYVIDKADVLLPEARPSVR